MKPKTKVFFFDFDMCMDNYASKVGKLVIEYDQDYDECIVEQLIYESAWDSRLSPTAWDKIKGWFKC